MTNAYTYLKWTPQMKRDHSRGENTDGHGRADATPTNLRALQHAAPFAEFCDRLFVIAEEIDAYDLTDPANAQWLLDAEALVREVAEIATTKLRRVLTPADRPLARGFGELVIAIAGTSQVTDQVRFGDGLDDMLGTARRVKPAS